MRDVFDAIADPTRRSLIRLLAAADEVALHDLTAEFRIGRTAVSKHLAILKEAGLILDRKVGRETRFRLNASPLVEVQDWVSGYSQFWRANLLRLSEQLGGINMSLNLTMDFEYATSAEKLWSALTDSSKLAQWVTNIQTGQAMENDFEPVVGRRFQFRTEPSEYWNGIIEGEVLEVDAPNRLSYTWASGEQHTVVWTLQDLGEGKVNLHLEQTGFTHARGVEGARYGWGKWCGDLEKILA